MGFRAFVLRHAKELELTGWARNEDSGHVRVYAVGPPDSLNQMAAWLHKGPLFSEVRGVEETEAAMQQLDSFQTR